MRIDFFEASLEDKMIDRSRQPALSTRSPLAVPFKRSLRAGASVLALVVGGLGAGMVQPAFAADYTIDGGKTETVPGTHDSGWQVDGSLNVGGTDGGALNVNSGAQVTVKGGLSVGGSTASVGKWGGVGVVTVDGAGSSLGIRDGVSVGIGHGDGTLNITNGGTVSGTDGNIGHSGTRGSQGYVTVDGQGSSLMLSGKLEIGRSSGRTAYGTLIIRGGGAVTSGTLGGVAPYSTIGTGTGDGLIDGTTGTVVVDGVGSTWIDISSETKIGSAQTGTLTISNGAIVTQGDKGQGKVEVGRLGGSGTLNIGGAVGESAAGAGQLRAQSVIIGVGGVGTGGTGRINFNHTDTNYRFDPSISGVGTINQLAGLTSLTADNSGFTGTLNINGGTLSVGSEKNLGDATVALDFDGGILQITGTDFNETSRTINWGSEGGGFDIADAGNTFTVGQKLA